MSSPPVITRATGSAGKNGLVFLPGDSITRTPTKAALAKLFAGAGVIAGSDTVVFTYRGDGLVGILFGRPIMAKLLRERAQDDKAGQAGAAYVNRSVLASLIGEVVDAIHQTISWCAQHRGGIIPVVLLLSGFDQEEGGQVPVPGVSLVRAYETAKIPEQQREAVTRYLHDRLASALMSLHAPAERVYVLGHSVNDDVSVEDDALKSFTARLRAGERKQAAQS